ncbi:MAG: alpha/beta hydrolase-fold protein [bacterium]
MEIKYHKFFSAKLGQDFEFKSYGSQGKPLMVFPTACGRFWDYEDRGMIAAAAEFAEKGDVRIFAMDSRDWESWYKPVKDAWTGLRHSQYEACIIEETIPFIAENCGVAEKFLAAGNSLGAFHAANFFLKYPGRFDSALCLSGLYSMKTELGGYADENIYFSEPLSYLPGLKDEKLLAPLRNGYAVISHGTGAWELFNGQAAELAGLLKSKGIPCWYDPWGPEWPHDWQTWHAQIRKYLACFREGVLFKDGVLKLTGPDRRNNKPH